MVKTWVKRLYMAFIFLLLYLPIIVLVVLSFNKSKARVTWRGFTFQWYANLFDNSRITDAFTTTLTLAFGSALAATIIGVVGAIGISAMKKAKLLYHAGSYQYPDVKCRDRYCIVSDTVIYPFYQIGIYHCIYRACDIRCSVCDFKCPAPSSDSQ